MFSPLQEAQGHSSRTSRMRISAENPSCHSTRSRYGFGFEIFFGVSICGIIVVYQDSDSKERPVPSELEKILQFCISC